VIPTLPEMVHELAGRYAYVAIVAIGAAAVLTAVVLLLQAFANCFDDTNSEKKP